MRDFFKTLLLVLSASAAFIIGFYVGGEKVKTRIPNFQEDTEENK
ncbi:MAG: hypothetical protein PVI11_06215 [Candidatus Aminicenantes bacterium]